MVSGAVRVDLGVQALGRVVREEVQLIVDDDTARGDARDDALAPSTEGALDCSWIGGEAVVDDGVHPPDEALLGGVEEALGGSGVPCSGDEAREDASRVVADAPPVRLDFSDPDVLLIGEQDGSPGVLPLSRRQAEGKLLAPRAHRLVRHVGVERPPEDGLHVPRRHEGEQHHGEPDNEPRIPVPVRFACKLFKSRHWDHLAMQRFSKLGEF